MGDVIAFPLVCRPRPMPPQTVEADYDALLRRAELAAGRLSEGVSRWARPISELGWLAADEDASRGMRGRMVAVDLARLEAMLAGGNERAVAVAAKARAARQRLEARQIAEVADSR